MHLVFSGELYDLFRDISIQCGGMPMSVFEPPQRYSWYDPALNFYNSIAYPPPETERGHTFCSMLRKSQTVDSMCIECDRRHTEECVKNGRPELYKCHLGFFEGMIPIDAGGVTACIFLGQVCTDDAGKEHFDSLWRLLSGWDGEYFTQDRYEEYYGYYSTRLCRLSEPKLEASFSMLLRLGQCFLAAGWIAPAAATLTDAVNMYLNQHISEPITSSGICSAMNVSRSALYRAVKSAYGIGFNNYVNRFKLERAKDMLLTGRSVKETAIALGYEDVSRFSKLFKTYTGIPPSSWADNSSLTQ